MVEVEFMKDLVPLVTMYRCIDFMFTEYSVLNIGHVSWHISVRLMFCH